MEPPLDHEAHIDEVALAVAIEVAAEAAIGLELIRPEVVGRTLGAAHAVEVGGDLQEGKPDVDGGGASRLRKKS